MADVSGAVPSGAGSPGAVPALRSRGLPSPGGSSSDVPGVPLGSGSREQARNRATLAACVAGLAVLLTGMRYELTLNVTLGTLAAVALAPVWIGSLARFRGATALTVVGLACLPMGVWLTALSAQERGTTDRLTIGSSVLLLNFVLGLGVILWARTLMPTPVVGLLFGVGMLLAAPGGGRFSENPWRFGFAVPATVVLLALAWWCRRRWVEVLAALALAAVTGAVGGRSMFAMLVLAALVVAWQAPPRMLSARTSRVRSGLFLLGAVAALYNLGQSLALEGYLGVSAQQRTLAQVSTAGSVILGGRPEVGATTALIGHEPWGFGAGSRLNATDLLVAKSGMADLGYDPNNGYVERYMFGGGIELHSFWADLWSDFGVVGAVLGAMILWRLASHLSGAIARRTASALIVYVVAQDVWNLFFSPRFGSYTLMVLGVALVLAPVARDRLARPAVPAPATPATTAPPLPGDASPVDASEA